MSQQFRKGDVVTLKSGGPKMTVQKYKWLVGLDFSKESDNEVICSWFDDRNELKTNTFEQDALKLFSVE